MGFFITVKIAVFRLNGVMPFLKAQAKRRITEQDILWQKIEISAAMSD
jgi:hypothetical protein